MAAPETRVPYCDVARRSVASACPRPDAIIRPVTPAQIDRFFATLQAANPQPASELE